MAGKTNRSGLEVTLPSDREILMTRIFDAPPHLVFEAFTRPELVRQWWCCVEGFTMTVCDIDLRIGGRYRFAMVGPDGVEHAFRGVYKEIAPGKRLVHTETYEMFPDAESLITSTFDDRFGQTLYASVSAYPSTEVRDMVIKSGMEEGVRLGFDRLEEVVRAMSGRVRAAAGGAA